MASSFLFIENEARCHDKFKLAFHKIIRVGNIVILCLLSVTSFFHDSYSRSDLRNHGLGMTTLEVGLLQLPQAWCSWAWTQVPILAVKHAQVHSPWLNYNVYSIAALLAFHSTSGQVASVSSYLLSAEPL